MKRICLLLTGLLLLCGWAGAQNEKISFNETDHNFGVIGEKDGNATFNFILTNNSDEAIVVTNVVASCGCTKPVWTKEPVEPGKKGTISVSYNPLGRVAPFVKTITVTISNQAPIYLKIRGTVVQSFQEKYPVAIGNYLMKTKDLDFGRIEWKGTKTIHLEVYNNSDKPISQKALKLPKYLTVDFNPVIIPAKTAGVVDVTLNAQDDNSYGNLSGDFTLLINEARQSFSYAATVVDDFSQWDATKKANAGKINVSDSEIYFGNFASGNSKMVKIANSGKLPLTVHTIQSSDPFISISKSHFAINPGEITEVKVTVDSKKAQTNLSSKVLIITDDPNTPVYEIGVKNL